jgi:predicted AlkP superfamily pyrophosphatase or phosphodiesterase
MRSIVCLCLLAASSLKAATRTEHVFLVSIDGGKPAVIHETEMPRLKKLAAEGAVTWVANTIFPPKTLPSHTSMTTGVGPDKHQVLWNDWLPLRGIVRVPTIFSLAKAQDPATSTALFTGKAKFRHLWVKDSLDVLNFGENLDPAKPTPVTEEKKVVPAQAVAKNAAAWIVEKKPRLCMIHFPDADSAGHKSGWGSPEQKEAFRVCDQALGQIVRAIEQAGIADRSVIIVTADHGGHEKNHSENIPDDMNIPWIAWGQGVKKGHAITSAVTTYDSAATALWLLDVPVPASFDGKPVAEAFVELPTPAPHPVPLPQPTPAPLPPKP